MGYRRKAREYALQMLYQYDISRESEGFSNEFWKNKNVQDEIREFTNLVVDGVMRNLSVIDGKISQSAENWSIERMAAVDRNILRMAVYELLYIKGIPVKVTINEAIEIAKRYAGEDSSAFVNGVLDRILRDHEELIGDKLKI